MKMSQISLLEWQKRFGTEKACVVALTKYRWPQGCMCPKCGHNSSYYIKTRKVYQCTKCRHQVSVTAGTLFHSTNLPLVKWFWAIYLIASDKGWGHPFKGESRDKTPLHEKILLFFY